jgi:hypothetical protein
MNGDGITRRKFMGRTAAVGLGVLAHPTFSAKVLGANERIVMGIIGAGGMGRGHMENFKNLGAEWGAVCDVYDVNLDAGLEIAGPQAGGYRDYRALLDRKDIDAVLIATPEHWHHNHLVDAVQAGKEPIARNPCPIPSKKAPMWWRKCVRRTVSCKSACSGAARQPSESANN